MIGYLRGRVIGTYDTYCLLDAGGVGYRVFASPGTMSALPADGETEFYIHTAVREDAILLYGFATREEYEAFGLLVSVSGIGAKGALAILGAISVNDLYTAIGQEDTATLKTLPGVGKKSAERLVLELKDKVTAKGTAAPVTTVSPGGSISQEAMAALTALGYGAGEIAQVAGKFAAAASVEDALKTALKELGKR